MRVIAGDLKGRRLSAPKGTSTRPTTDRVREAIFSMIGPFFSGGVCLDLFAGSGALGIEAISRGMDEVIFVDKASAETIAKNVKQLGIEAASYLLKLPYPIAIKRLAQEERTADLVFLDPPYRLGVLEDAMQLLLKAQILREDAVVVAEMDHKTAAPDILELLMRKEAVYGSTKIVIYEYACAK
ncbi:16S rRNA (guanine(966)-N(2))-methyltransferase RsmD [Sulfoacidibacillus thermotolerans]|uniref:16S rRNA (Guanine(966)-N(2))-methyltransferase RsmD n=2 Tax=Sulfoacidibacillus thermotolerans TaxID=1765684 RepID=A0A2U3D7X5_SULT2|nr:16S rRNA (guanine(966)-N(2))-methyltransferase RsmD [Sulfoacidibacillus thermotolerans]